MREIIFLNEARNRSAIDHGGTKKQGGACTVRVSPKAYDPTVSTGTYTPQQQLLYKEYQEAKKNGFVGSFSEWRNADDVQIKPTNSDVETQPKPKHKETDEERKAKTDAYPKWKKARENGYTGSLAEWIAEKNKKSPKKK